MNKEHLCAYYAGRIKDVVFRPSDKTIYCRRCGKQLSESEIDPKTFKEILYKFR